MIMHQQNPLLLLFVEVYNALVKKKKIAGQEELILIKLKFRCSTSVFIRKRMTTFKPISAHDFPIECMHLEGNSGE